ncbi:uncharacterized protein LOC133332152 [Musca vetustissima]|uniref:uncharacterized protein LOC133332152 n=1 Tax=Musca vetustissima TaxID=27455 RepID=UPI002AB64427|nr:uncharacterized protein LOC133332152 [Musca vetustissima]
MTSNNIKNLRQLSPEERKEFLESFDVIFFDCDGVLWMVTGGPIPGVFEALQRLKDQGKRVKFVSNNSVRSHAEYLERFAKYGMANVQEDDIVHPVKSMIWYLKRHKPNAVVLPLVGKAGRDLLVDEGLNVVNMDLDTTTCAAMGYFVLKHGPPKVDYVLADVNPSAGYIHLVKALEYLKDPQCQLLLGAMDAVIPLAAGHTMPGYLDFYNFLIKHSNKQPIVLGKPSQLLADILKERFGISQPQRCLFVGDSLKMDINFGKSVGFQTLFVLSGANTKEDMLNTEECNQPDYYADSVGDFMELFVN